MKIVTVEQMQRLEESSASEGVSTDTLMENAGLAVAKVASREMGLAAGRRILVLVGPGNNGGDGLVAARHLQRWSAEVTAYVLIPRRDEDPKLKLALEYGVQVLSAKDDSVDALLARSDLVIDAVLGTGKARPLEGIIKEAMKQLRASRERSNTKILALDLPTGLNADTGETDPACLDADVTVALGYPKDRTLSLPGRGQAGQAGGRRYRHSQTRWREYPTGDADQRLGKGQASPTASFGPQGHIWACPGRCRLP